MATDEDLMAAVAAGDGRALEELCRRYERPLYQFLFRHTGGRDVDDLYQDTWLRVVRAAGRFDRRRRFSTWLFQIAVNLSRDWRRRPPPEAVDPAAIDTGPGAGSAAGGSAGTHDPTAARDAALDARRMLADLPEAQRAVVILRYFHDFSEDEVAEILDCPRGTVKSRMHTAMAHLIARARAERS